MSPEREFENNMNQLVRLLQKLLKNLPGKLPFSKLQGKPGETGMNLNICFFNFLPMSPEDLDAFEEAYEQAAFPEDRGEEFSRELSPSDMEFLRRNGIRF